MSCEGCSWYRPQNQQIKCLNITKINRSGWNPRPERKCVEYDGSDREDLQQPGTSRDKGAKRASGDKPRSRSRAGRSKQSMSETS